MDKRIKEIRKSKGYSQQKFADELGIARGNIAAYEVGKNLPSDAVISLICTKCGINEEWLRTGNGEMRYIAEDETAAIVSDLLEKDNPLYEIILGILKTYQNLDKDSQNILDYFALELLKEIKGED